MNKTKQTDKATAIQELRIISSELWKSGDKVTSDFMNKYLSRVEAEHAALVAVAEAAEQANKWIGSGERCPNLKCALNDAIANLAAVRKGAQ